ncbi:MAG: hypothetical protein A2Z38_00520 [Planctomycetes bacterium RBG_19FT_COMBO_48_8]|nr:MAG: hypothetical protein A2Z38_00520 [Planctomycetes bacterium RBG_19FT_COMBO_48_8]
MKIYRYQIEFIFIWLILATFSRWVYADKLGVLINQLMIQESLQKKTPFTNKIRPPPLFDWRF